MAKTNNNPQSKKGKAKAPRNNKPATAVAKGPETAKVKGPARVKATPNRSGFSSCATVEEIVGLLRRAGADDGTLASVGRLTLPTRNESGPTDAPARSQSDLSRNRLVRILIEFVQFERQTENWMVTPKFLSNEMSRVVEHITPPGRNAAFIEAVKAHGDNFCRAVAQTTQQHLADSIERTRQILIHWSDARVVPEAVKIAKGRLQKLYGKKQTAEDIRLMLQTAVDCLPRDPARPWSESEMDVGEAPAGTSSAQ